MRARAVGARRGMIGDPPFPGGRGCDRTTHEEPVMKRLRGARRQCGARNKLPRSPELGRRIRRVRKNLTRENRRQRHIGRADRERQQGWRSDPERLLVDLLPSIVERLAARFARIRLCDWCFVVCAACRRGREQPGTIDCAMQRGGQPHGGHNPGKNRKCARHREPHSLNGTPVESTRSGVSRTGPDIAHNVTMAPLKVPLFSQHAHLLVPSRARTRSTLGPDKQERDHG
jgi:hypothetical protein